MDYFDEKEIINTSSINLENEQKNLIIRDDDYYDYSETQKKMWDSYPRISHPEKLNIKLFPHQLVSVYNMELLEKVRKIKENKQTETLSDKLINEFKKLSEEKKEEVKK